MELNLKASLKSTLLMEISLSDTEADWTVSLPVFQPSDFLTLPEGANHFRLFVAGASVDFVSGDRSFVLTPSDVLPLASATDAISLTVSKGDLDEANKVFILGVEFIQVVNGQEYAINNGAHNAAAILLAEKA